MPAVAFTEEVVLDHPVQGIPSSQIRVVDERSERIHSRSALRKNSSVSGFMGEQLFEGCGR